jgi:protein ImuB
MNAPSRRYLSLWLKRLATDRIARRSSTPADAPLVVAAPIKSALRIVALNDAAARFGLKTGMSLADARAMYPALAVADADPQADQDLLKSIADWCDRYTPLVALDAPDGLMLDVTGCAHLFGGEAALCRDMVARLDAQGLQARAAAADTPGCAWAAARYGRSIVVPRGEARAALLPLPLAALRLAPDTVDALAQVGLKTIADIIELPRAPLAARFGAMLVRRLDQALGREEEPISPCLPVPAYVAEQRFAEPIALERDVLGTLAHLAQELARALERRGEGARLLQAALFRADGKVARMEVGTAAPLREPQRMARLFVERLAALGDACDPGFGFDVVRLSALATERLDPAQTGFGAPDHSTELAHLIDRLGARFGLRRVTRLLPQDTHIPEFAVVSVPAQAAHFPPPERVAERSEGGWGSFSVGGGDPHLPAFARCASFGGRPPPFRERYEGAVRASGEESSQDSLAPTRPLRLFARPERIEAIAEVPDGPPVRFRWRRVLHEVAQAEGPERIAFEWWRDEAGRALTRDYFRVESKAGVRVWLYREGLYGRETAQPRWFLHGLFA